ncbi:MAG: type II toxin-antitoxin system RelE/ParE family toxin [Syntrophomonadaceae bacterium]|nr:type II toxin-antitoxin system RelE/ParE family toxin [Syntrophomonadaceae bacterium]
MYEVFFYKDKNGNSPIADYLRELTARKDKNSRIKANKINDYIQYLAQEGKNAGGPYIKHLDGEIWELRPLRDRILFAAWDGDSFVLLHYFIKKTQKTPKRAIDQAIRNFSDLKERKDSDG